MTTPAKNTAAAIIIAAIPVSVSLTCGAVNKCFPSLISSKIPAGINGNMI